MGEGPEVDVIASETGAIAPIEAISERRLALIGHAVNLLNNHLMRFGNHAGVIEGSELGREIQLSMEEHTPAVVVAPLTEALTNAARFLAAVFAEATEDQR